MTALVQKRFGFEEGTVELYAEKVAQRGLCAIAQAESLRYKLVGGLAVRRACYGVLRFIMESGAKGCEVVVSGKLRGQRAKSMKFTDGLMIHSGYPRLLYVDTAVRHVHLRQGMLCYIFFYSISKSRVKIFCTQLGGDNCRKLYLNFY